MQTPLILNQANASASPSSKQANNAPPEAPFNHVLSREISDRQSTQAPAKAAPKEADKPAAPVKQQQPQQQTAGKSETSTSTENKADQAQDAAASDAAAATAAPVDMLALVANLTQAITSPAEPVAAEPTEKASPAALGIQGGADKALLLQNAQALASEENKASALPSDFAKVMTGAKETPSAPEALADLSKAGKAKEPAIDLAAAAKGRAEASEQQPLAAKKQDAVADLSAGKAKEAAPDLAGILKAKEALPGPAAPVTAPVQQASLNLAQAVMAQPVEKLSPPVGTPAWDQALGQKVVWMVAGAQQSATMTLNPPDLGPLQVVLNVNNDQASATFISAQPEVRQALEAAMPKLREMMGDAGIQLGSATVSTGMPNHQNSSNEQASQRVSRFDNAGGSVDLSVRPLSVGAVTNSGQGLVDTFA